MKVAFIGLGHMGGVLPQVLRFNLAARQERLADVAFALGAGDTARDRAGNAAADIAAILTAAQDLASWDDGGLTSTRRLHGFRDRWFPARCPPGPRPARHQPELPWLATGGGHADAHEQP
jgi:alcohol dehydrogenase class IV